jgi:hypothetical protein
MEIPLLVGFYAQRSSGGPRKRAPRFLCGGRVSRTYAPATAARRRQDTIAGGPTTHSEPPVWGTPALLRGAMLRRGALIGDARQATPRWLIGVYSGLPQRYAQSVAEILGWSPQGSRPPTPSSETLTDHHRLADTWWRRAVARGFEEAHLHSATGASPPIVFAVDAAGASAAGPLLL